MLEEFPIMNGTREELVGYLCMLHNKVNERLNKPIFECENAFKYWGGECGCTEKGNTTSTSTTTNQENVPTNLK